MNSKQNYIGKMKTKSEASKWSSMQEVMESFNSVSYMPQVKCQDHDIFSCPSPPKHRISPSQIELIESMGHNADRIVDDESRAGMRRYEQRISPKVRDASLTNDIRATKISTYSNDSIENYFKCYTNGNLPLVPEEEVDSESEKCSDEVSVASLLRADASEFYPPGLTPDPVELSECLMKLKLANGTCARSSRGKSETRSSYSSFSPKKSPSSGQSSGSFKNRSPAVVSDPRIGFYIGSDDDDDDDDEEAKIHVENASDSKVSFDSLTSTSTSQSQSTNSDLYPCSKSPVLLSPANDLLKPSDVSDSKPVVEKDTGVSAKPRQKRIMRNALLSSLSLKNQTETQNHLMKPTDFCISTNAFKPSNSSAFHPFESENSKTAEINPTRPYNFQTDPSIDEESKKLMALLTCDSISSPSLSTTSGQSSSSFNSPTMNSPKSKAPKPISYYDYTYKENDFPPLI